MAASTNKMLFYLVIACFVSINGDDSAEWNTRDYLRKEHSLIKPYTDDHWDFIGSTMVTGNLIRLTPDHQGRKGQIWNRVPCMIRGWELHVHFKVHGSGRDLFGDGIAIWYARDRMQLGPVFGSKDYFHGLAIFLDTYANQNGPHGHGHPYISAMINNGSLHYDHDRDGTHTELAGCEAKIRSNPYETHVAIRYENKILSVSTDVDGKNGWKPCFSVEGVRLPTGYFFGLSAATGDLADNHDIISMKLYDLGGDTVSDEDLSHVIPSAEVFTPPRDHVDDPKVSRLTGWRLVLLVIVGLVVVGACIVIGIVVISKQQDRRKRLY